MKAQEIRRGRRLRVSKREVVPCINDETSGGDLARTEAERASEREEKEGECGRDV